MRDDVKEGAGKAFALRRELPATPAGYEELIGPATRSALAQAVTAGKILDINNLIVDKRIAELNTKGHKVDNRGWFPRAESFRILPIRTPVTP